MSYLAIPLRAILLVSLPPVLLDQGHTLFNPFTSLPDLSPNTVTLRVKSSTYMFWGILTDTVVDENKNLKFIVMSYRVYTCMVMSSVVVIINIL